MIFRRKKTDPTSKLDHPAREIRELTAAELEEVSGGQQVCANGEHIKSAVITVREGRTPVAYFGGIPIF